MFFFSSRRRHTRWPRDWSSDVCSSDLSFQAALDLAIATKAKDSAQLAGARSDLERFQTLAPQNLTSTQVLQEQQALVAQLAAQVKGDQANIENARTQLGYTTITAPIQGITGIRRVDPGNIVHATDSGNPLYGRRN